MATDEDLPITLTKEEKKIILWHIHVLDQAGFTAEWTGRLASIGNLDPHEAVRLKEAGCPQNLVYELLS